jgi:hypothetical protein
MKLAEAIKILRPERADLDGLKAAYRAAALKWHPDRNGGSLEAQEMMKAINEAFELLRDNLGFWTVGQGTGTGAEDGGGNGRGRTWGPADPETEKELTAVYERIKHFEGLEIEICGKWLWVGGNTLQWRTQLKEAGLSWASKKQKWYWKPGGTKERRKGYKWTMDQVRERYGSEDLKTEKREYIF